MTAPGHRVRAAWLALALNAPGFLGAEGRVKIAETPAGILPADVETRLLLRGFAGEIRVRLGTAGEVRYRSVRAGSRGGADLPLDVWRTGSSFEMTAPDGAAPEPRILEVNVPSRMSVEVETSDAKVLVQGLRSGLDVRGARIDLDARSTEGPLTIDIQEGRVHVESAAGDVRTTGTKLEGRFSKLRGRMHLRLSDSTIEVEGAGGTLDADLERTAFRLAGLAGPIRLEAVEGTVEIRGMQSGGELVLTGAPVLLQESRGDLDIQTDAEVRFLNTDADLHVDSYGGAVHGTGNTGLLEVRTSDAKVTVAEVAGPTRVTGRGLEVDLQRVSGEIFVEVVSSVVTIADASSEILVLSENGNVTVQRAATDVEVKSAGGEVHLLDVHGPLQIEADGDQVEVSLLSPFALKDSVVRNEGGTVELRVPPRLGIRLLAETRFGSIKSSLPTTSLSEDASSAELEIGPQGGDHATLRVFAARDIVLDAR